MSFDFSRISERKRYALVFEGDEVCITTNGKIEYNVFKIKPEYVDDLLEFSKILMDNSITLILGNSLYTLKRLFEVFDVKNKIECADLYLHLTNNKIPSEFDVCDIFNLHFASLQSYREECETALAISRINKFGVWVNPKVDTNTKAEEDFIQSLNECTNVCPDYNMLTASGRIYSSNPNIQNVPKRIRDEVIIAPYGFRKWSIDYDQIELRVAAYYSEDQRLTQALEEDIHLTTAKEVVGCEDREIGKTINYAMLYGGSNKAIEKILRSKTGKQLDGSKVIRKFFGFYKDLKKCVDYVTGISEKGELLSSAFGKILKPANPRLAFNLLVQSTAADIFKRAIVSINNMLSDFKSRIAFPLHDELVMYIHDDEDFVISSIKNHMVKDFRFNLKVREQ